MAKGLHYVFSQKDVVVLKADVAKGLRNLQSQEDVVVLKADVAKGLRQLEGSAASAADSVAALIELDRVKTRMEAAASTLKVGLAIYHFSHCLYFSVFSSPCQRACLFEAPCNNVLFLLYVQEAAASH